MRERWGLYIREKMEEERSLFNFVGRLCLDGEEKGRGGAIIF